MGRGEETGGVGVRLGNPERSLINCDNVASDFTTSSNLPLANDVLPSSSDWQFSVLASWLHWTLLITPSVSKSSLCSAGIQDPTFPNSLLITLLPVVMGSPLSFTSRLESREVCPVPPYCFILHVPYCDLLHSHGFHWHSNSHDCRFTFLAQSFYVWGSEVGAQ